MNAAETENLDRIEQELVKSILRNVRNNDGYGIDPAERCSRTLVNIVMYRRLESALQASFEPLEETE